MKPLRVLVVDDSAYSRRVISRILEHLDGVEVVGYAVDGEEAIRQVISLKPDLVTVDLEMPRIDGFTLIRILCNRFNMPIIVISALSDADRMFRALEMGALDFVAKPVQGSTVELMGIEQDLKWKVRQVTATLVSRQAAVVTLPSSPAIPGERRVTLCDKVDLVAIGSSTGGPPALQGILSSFDTTYEFGIVVAQHMPPGFTRAFAERLDRTSKFSVREAADGDRIEPGLALIAPGGHNLQVVEEGTAASVRIIAPTPEDRYHPSVDLLFRSAAEVYGDRMLAVVLTGMGNDGKQGVVAVKERGGRVIAESQDTAVVYGMPREAIATGVVDRIVPLTDMSQAIVRIAGCQ